MQDNYIGLDHLGSGACFGGLALAWPAKLVKGDVATGRSQDLEMGGRPARHVSTKKIKTSVRNFNVGVKNDLDVGIKKL